MALVELLVAALLLVALHFNVAHAQELEERGSGRILQAAPKHAYVAACLLVKNEHLYIREFIQYHRWIGIEKFYVWDHQSSPPMADVLSDHVLSGLVELVYFSDSWRADAVLFPSMYNTSTRGFMSPQGWAYDNCFRMFGHRHTFMTLIDPDEYIVLKGVQPPAVPDLPAFLKPFEPIGGLLVHWQLFGPSGHVARPNGSTLEAYTQCQPRHVLQRFPQFHSIPLGFVKSITATRCYQRGCNPHVCELRPGCKYVNEDMMELSGPVVRAVHWDRIAVFHYVTRSVTDYKAKMARGTGHSQFLAINKAMGKTHRGWKYFRTINRTSIATCTEGKQAWERCCKGGTGEGGAGSAAAAQSQAAQASGAQGAAAGAGARTTAAGAGAAAAAVAASVGGAVEEGGGQKVEVVAGTEGGEGAHAGAVQEAGAGAAEAGAGTGKAGSQGGAAGSQGDPHAVAQAAAAIAHGATAGRQGGTAGAEGGGGQQQQQQAAAGQGVEGEQQGRAGGAAAAQAVGAEHGDSHISRKQVTLE
ncbi:hypothetical protein HYH03_012492 [Edaphochlamys debaryana]|uniref:Glycosyltransferase family 92 protein n=1 Tax=Edaphochlamys debaryana TaxID=47281 RepID=A0A836BTZ1_9CHLO|nr:hypothetical protein HYH03_012492 [Edaphochlamys debaryana]|eukprot:KAG2489056.1 hypothetical protein HYH03_012492 [Edaphochlamys debaryana]